MRYSKRQREFLRFRRAFNAGMNEEVSILYYSESFGYTLKLTYPMNRKRTLVDEWKCIWGVYNSYEWNGDNEV